MKAPRRKAAGTLLGLFLFSHAAWGLDLGELFGTYVGVATAEDLATGTTKERHLDVVISPYRKKGFQINWITVILVDGRRDVPGVRRKVNRALFVPGKRKCCFVQVDEYNPFSERKPRHPMEGEPVRWAVLDASGLRLYSFAVTEGGGYELQTYDRRLMEHGIDLRYELIKDGVVKRRITGRTVRVEDER